MLVGCLCRCSCLSRACVSRASALVSRRLGVSCACLAPARDVLRLCRAGSRCLAMSCAVLLIGDVLRCLVDWRCLALVSRRLAMSCACLAPIGDVLRLSCAISRCLALVSPSCRVQPPSRTLGAGAMAQGCLRVLEGPPGSGEQHLEHQRVRGAVGRPFGVLLAPMEKQGTTNNYECSR